MTSFRAESYPAAESHRRLEFESVEITPGFIPGTFFLTVTGTRPCSNMRVTLSPRIYIRCPEYWGIEVVGHLPTGICLERTTPYSETIPLSGITGSVGIEVIGATRTEEHRVPGGCTGDPFTAESPAAGKQFIVIALTASAGEKHLDCSIVSEDAAYPAVYSQAFGPASSAECERWMADHCGFDGGDPPE
jgi:hypothetical protein